MTQANNTGKRSLFAKPTVLRCLVLTGLVIALDQWSKYLIVEHFVYAKSQEVLSIFNLVRVHNTGVAFSFLASDGGWQRWFFTTLGFGASALMYRLIYLNKNQPLFCWALALISGGAIGNVIDRLNFGYVVDFLDFHWLNWHFAAFNLADSAITLGAALLIVYEFLRSRELAKSTQEAA
jgi:signal peptidase II